MSLLDELPDDRECYIAGVGVVRLGELRAVRKPPSIVDEATRRMIEEKVTRNLDPLPPCRHGAGASERRA